MYRKREMIKLTIHDTREFPLVYLRGEHLYDGYGQAWCEEMQGLIAQDQEFILIYLANENDESHEDRRVRGLWLKANKERLARLCLSMIIVEGDATKRSTIETMIPNIVRAFGTPQVVSASEEEAVSLAREILTRS